jgi:peptidoglycan-associated lipoprotein
MRNAVNGLLGSVVVVAGTLWGLGCGGPKYPNCETDNDCHQGEFCVNNLCQQCRGDQDCPAGQSCVSGACQVPPGYCTTSADCGPGEECQNNTCVTARQSVVPQAPAPVASGCTLDAVYFDFDSSTLSDSSRSKLADVANCIRSRGLKSVHATGLTDPRGTEEYNLALGDRRAQSAKKYLETLGVEAQVSASSMGEELATGSDEASWARDRRVDFQER